MNFNSLHRIRPNLLLYQCFSAEGELRNPGPDKTTSFAIPSCSHYAEILEMPEEDGAQCGPSRGLYRALGPLKLIMETDEEAMAEEENANKGTLGVINEEDEDSFRSVDVVVHERPRDV